MANSLTAEQQTTFYPDCYVTDKEPEEFLVETLKGAYEKWKAIEALQQSHIISSQAMHTAQQLLEKWAGNDHARLPLVAAHKKFMQQQDGKLRHMSDRCQRARNAYETIKRKAMRQS